MTPVCANLRLFSYIYVNSQLTSLYTWQGGTINKCKLFLVLMWNSQIKYFWVFGSLHLVTGNIWLLPLSPERNQVRLDATRVLPGICIRQIVWTIVCLTMIESIRGHIRSHYRDNLWVCSATLIPSTYSIFSGFAPNPTLTQYVDQNYHNWVLKPVLDVRFFVYIGSKWVFLIERRLLAGKTSFWGKDFSCKYTFYPWWTRSNLPADWVTIVSTDCKELTCFNNFGGSIGVKMSLWSGF